MVLAHRWLKSKVVWILFLIASFQFTKMLLESESFKNISSTTEDHIIFLSNNKDQDRDNVKDFTEKLDGTGTISDIDDTLTSISVSKLRSNGVYPKLSISTLQILLVSTTRSACLHTGIYHEPSWFLI